MGLLPQLVPKDVLVFHCPLCSYHSLLLNNIEQHFDKVHPDKIIDYIIYRCSLCHKVASCRNFMNEHISLIHNKPADTNDQHILICNGQNSSSKSTSPDSSDLYSNIAFMTIYFSGKLYSKSHRKSNGFLSDHSQVEQFPDARPCSTEISDSSDRLYKCIFCNSLHHTFQQLKLHYGTHGIRNLGDGTDKDDRRSSETNGSFLSEKALNIIDNDDNDDEDKLSKHSGFCKHESNENYVSQNHFIDNESLSHEQRPTQTSNTMSIDFLSQSPLKSFNQMTTSLQNRSSLFNLIMQHSANQNSQPLSNDEKISPTIAENFCSVGLTLPFPISNKVPSFNQRLNGNNWFGNLSPGQLITSPILSSLHTQFGLPSLHQHMMNAYAAANGTNPSNGGFNCTSPNAVVVGQNLMTNTVDSANSGTTPVSPTFSNNDLFQIPKGFPSVFSSVINANGTNQLNSSVENSVDLSSNSSKKAHDKVLSSSESDRSSVSLSPTDKYKHLNNRIQQDEHSDPSSGPGTNNMDVNHVEESQIYSMKRVVGLSRTNLPFQARKILFGWLTSHLREPYPSEEEKIRLANETGLSRTTVNNWFINARRRYVKPLLQGKLGMTSGVLKSMLENNNVVIHGQRNQFTQNITSSGLKRRSIINSGENDGVPTIRRRSNSSNNNSIKRSQSHCLDNHDCDGNIKFEYDNCNFDETPKKDFPNSEIVESCKENRVIVEKRPEYTVDNNATELNIIASSYKDIPQDLPTCSVVASVGI